MLTQERLKELLDYDPSTGLFTWRVKKPRVDIGDIAGSPQNAYAAYVIAAQQLFGEFARI